MLIIENGTVDPSTARRIFVVLSLGGSWLAGNPKVVELSASIAELSVVGGVAGGVVAIASNLSEAE